MFQAMSVSSPESSERNANPDGEEDAQSDSDSTANVLDVTDYESTSTQNKTNATSSSTSHVVKDRILQGLKNGIEPEPDSVASDYSEMADSIKEHLANVQIIQKEDLEAGNTMFPDQFTVGQKITQGPDETDEEFSKRLRKINYLSLAQEFAALKKVDADALPFGLQKGSHNLYDVTSPMSETSSETGSERYLTDSAEVTPMEPLKEFVPKSSSGEDSGKGESGESELELHTPKEAWQDSPSSKSARTAINATSQSSINNKPQQITKASTVCTDRIDNQRQNKTLSYGDQSKGQSPKRQTVSQVSDNKSVNERTSTRAKHTGSNSSKTLSRDDVDSESSVISPATTRKGADRKKSFPDDKLGDFDVYNIETTLPQVDWETLEKQLKKAAEEEQMKAQVGLIYLDKGEHPNQASQTNF